MIHNKQIPTIEVTKDGIQRLVQEIHHMETVLQKDGDEIIIAHDGINIFGSVGMVRIRFVNVVAKRTWNKDVMIAGGVVLCCIFLVLFALVASKKKASSDANRNEVERRNR